MEDRWKDKNINLSILSNRLVQFFEARDFVTFREDSEKKYHIVVAPRRFHDILEEIDVYVSGEPDSFKVRFDSGARSRELVRYGILTTVFGGGRLTLKGLKSQEALEKLEREFWIYLDRVIWSLSGCAGDFTRR